MPEPNRYEYHVLSSMKSGDALAVAINALGAEGWEPISISGGLFAVHVLLRRLRAVPVVEPEVVPA